jgi:hypothetical protein
MSNDHSASQSITDATGTGAASSKPAMLTVSIFQLAVFTLAVGWSLVYVFVIYFEICQCKGNRKPLRQNTCELEMGLLISGGD